MTPSPELLPPPLPYDRRAAREILDDGVADADERRYRLYGVLRDYDRTLERGNIERNAVALRERGELLIFGRMSRAFHNQALLFADAVLVPPRRDWPEPPETDGLADRATEFALAALRLLLRSPGAVPLTLWNGSLQQFEDAVLDAQRSRLAAALQPLRTQVANHTEYLNGAAAGVDLTPAFRDTEQHLQWAQRLRRCLLEAEHRPAAFVVVSQRPSPTGSHLLVKLNEGRDPYPGKAANLAKLFERVGDRIYGSPDYGWLEVADHWIEAIPLFVHEETLVGTNHTTTQTVVDINELEESFREEMADGWTQNLRRVLDSEFLALARRVLASTTEGDDDSLRGKLRAAHADSREIAALGVLFATAYRRHLAEIQRCVEQLGLEPYAAAQSVLLESTDLEQAREVRRRTGSWCSAVVAVLEPTIGCQAFEAALERLAPEAFLPRRPLPALHVLTTQSAGMTDAYVRSWLEESMALYNAVEDLGLTDAVEARRRWHDVRLHALSEKLIREFGLWVEVEELRAGEGLAVEAAAQRVISRHPLLSEEVACLGTLLELHQPAPESTPPSDVADPVQVEAILAQEAATLRDIALSRVLERNGPALRHRAEDYRREHPELDEREALLGVVEDDALMRSDLQVFERMAARRWLLERIDERQPECKILDLCRSFVRRYRNLSKTTARREILAERGLQHSVSHPLYHFSATGGAKRYHLVYSPSRVDLGVRERESVETWSQWVGGADLAAMRAGKHLYQLINKDVRAFESLEEPEVLKTGENAAMASHYAYSNALGLMVTATRRGDAEEMADQMNRRRDRCVHPPGEGYGGYCVPKDGLFLEFVLSLRQGDNLSQMGLPPTAHDVAVRLAGELLEHRSEFTSEQAWSEWGAQRLRQAALIPAHARTPLPPFLPLRCAQAMEGLGRPILRDAHRIGTRLAARWSLHKMVTGGEQVNRFMPFFKTWLIRQAVAEAARRRPGSRIAMANAVVVLTAEYKPDTCDGRFSVGLRKFELLAGTGSHLLAALDPEGQDLAILLDRGYTEFAKRGDVDRLADWLETDPAVAGVAEQLDQLFPPAEPPAEIRMVSPTGLSPLDLLNYTSDTRLSQIADEVRAELKATGISSKDIDANLRAHGPRMERWDCRVPGETEAHQIARQRIGGRVHALSLAVLGPERDYRRAVQGADVLDTGIPHTALLKVLEDTGRLCRLMLTGNPHSALAIVDGASGARPRTMNRLDVMLWFAAGMRHGREPVYLGIGVGLETTERWRAAMCRRSCGAERLLSSLEDGSAAARAVYAELLGELRANDAARVELDEAAKLLRTGRIRDRDWHYATALSRALGEADLATLDFAGFLAIGGMFLLAGADRAEIDSCYTHFRNALGRFRDSSKVSEPPWEPLLPLADPRLVSDTWVDVRGTESSNKAMEERPAVALEQRQQLEERLERARGLCQRWAAFRAIGDPFGDFAAHYRAAMDVLEQSGGPMAETDFGRFIAHTRHALTALAAEFAPAAAREAMLRHIDRLCSGRRIEPELWQEMAGGYEDIGDFGRMAQHVAEQERLGQIDQTEKRCSLERMAEGIELFEILLAVETLQPTASQSRDDAGSLWRALADFFARTLNDHTYEYRPWLYSRGTGFTDLAGDALYGLASARHAWLYRYLRHIVIEVTELRDLPDAEQDSLLGNFLDGRREEAIGAEGSSLAECAWRAYGQIRELAFLRNDGFPLPAVFPEFDPALIADHSRVNHVIAAPVGRTHFSRMLCEGPTLARELVSQGRIGANLIIGRKIELQPVAALGRSVALIRSGHFYIDADTYHAALARHPSGRALAGVGPKGIRVAARFTRPIQAALVYPFHGDPVYRSGALEEAGLPYTVQSLFHTWTTYDKAKYPSIFSSGVELPMEVDWLAAWTARGDESEVKCWIRDGLAGTGYPGLASFAERCPNFIVKDAAESGGRNMRLFRVRDAGLGMNPDALNEAVDFVHQISLRHNVAVQEFIHGSPELWATEGFMQDFVRRQVLEWGQGIDRGRDPCPPIYGSLRVIVSTDRPEEPDPAKWHLSHWITLNSRHPITNVGRGGTLEQLRPEVIRPEIRSVLLNRLAEAARRAAQALADYERNASEVYREETGRPVGCDLMGISYGHPRYLMLDFLATPVFAEDVAVRLRPCYNENGTRQDPCFVQHQAGRETIVVPVDWRVVLIEPNVGIGLWDRVALREEVHELQRAAADGRAPDWDRVGENARIVLRDLHRAGEEYLSKLRG